MEELKLPKGHESWITIAKYTKGNEDDRDFNISVRNNDRYLDIISIKAGTIRSKAFIELIESEELLSDNELYRIMNILKSELEPLNPLTEKIERILENRYKKQIHF